MARTMTLVVPEEIAVAAKMKALQEGVSVSAVVRAWLEAWASGDLPTPAIAKEEPE